MKTLPARAPAASASVLLKVIRVLLPAPLFWKATMPPFRVIVEVLAGEGWPPVRPFKISVPALTITPPPNVSEAPLLVWVAPVERTTVLSSVIEAIVVPPAMPLP